MSCHYLNLQAEYQRKIAQKQAEDQEREIQSFQRQMVCVSVRFVAVSLCRLVFLLKVLLCQCVYICINSHPAHFTLTCQLHTAGRQRKSDAADAGKLCCNSKFKI